MNCFTDKLCTDADEFNLFSLKKLKFAIAPALTNILNLCIMHCNLTDVFKLKSLQSTKTVLSHDRETSDPFQSLVL